MADRNYWVRTEQGRTWGPFTLEKLKRLRGQLTEKSEASLDGETFRPGSEFPELRELLSPPRKIEKQASPLTSAQPRISKAMAEAFGIDRDAPAAAPAPRQQAPAQEPVPEKPKVVAPPPPQAPLEVPLEGDLAELSPVRLYALAAHTLASGALVLQPEKGGALTLSFRRGNLEHLRADDPQLSLLRYLQQRGTLTGEQALAAEEQARQPGQDPLTVLLQQQLLPPADAHQVLGDHAKFLLDRALVAFRGSFRFDREAAPPPGAFPLGQRWGLLVESVRRLEAPLLRARVGKRLLRPVVRSGGLAIGRLEELSLNAQETRLYASIDGTRTGEELLKAQEASLALRLLYLLTELGHLSFTELHEEAEAPPPAQAKGDAPPPPRAAPEPKRELPKTAREMGRVPPPSPREAPKGPRAPPPVMHAAPAARPAASAASPALKEAPPAPQLSRPPPAFAQPPAGETPQAALRRLSALRDRLDQADHFEALGLQRKTATAAEAKRNFFVLAKELHPDTVTDPSQEPLREVKERLFARINAAAQVLGDDQRRKEYEDELEGKKNSVDVARIFAAEEDFQRAEIMIKAHKYKEGLELLEKAIALNADEAEFYAWRGYARFLVSQDRKAAFEGCADDCRKAIKMVDRCLPAHLFLGHMSKVVGDLKLAQKCYQKVLELDDRHVEALRELRLMGKKG